MTDKDPKDMTASELLRQSDSNPCSMCHLVLAGDESCATTGCAEWAYRLADKIDAELSEARKDAIRESKKPMWWFRKAIKCGYDWPEPRDGEKFSDYLHRCFLPRPRFEDGEPVQQDDLFQVGCGLTAYANFALVALDGSCYWLFDDWDGELTDDRIKRPAPDVLGADGMPIKAGETVYDIDSEWLDTPLEVLSVESLSVKVSLPSGKGWTMFRADRLTHTPPETQERIDGDAAKDHVEYWRCSGFDCAECPSKIDGEKPWERYECSGACCDHAMVLDLLRRQRELDARKGGE